MKNLLIILICFIALPFIGKAQELNGRVVVNSDRLQGTDKAVFKSLESSLNTFVNTTRWSSTTFSPTEKIECNFSIVLVDQGEDNKDFFNAEITVMARRPVYNSSYSTTLINFRDTKFSFEYQENTQLEYVENSLSSNLVATMAFYCNLILGLDFDSFSPQGGSPFFRKAQSIAMQAQGYSTWAGWTAFESSTNRHAVITAFTDESLSGYRDFWYTYHRKGMDEMSANPDRARTTIIGALPILTDIKNTRSSSVLLQLFSDSKLDEVVAICSKATAEEKKEVYDLLYKLFPTSSNNLAPLKK